MKHWDLLIKLSSRLNLEAAEKDLSFGLLLLLGYPLLYVTSCYLLQVSWWTTCRCAGNLICCIASAPAFPSAHLFTSLLVLPYPDGSINFLFGAVLMLLLQTSTILLAMIELTSSSVLPASLIKKEKTSPSQCYSWKISPWQPGRCNHRISTSFLRAAHTENRYILWKEVLHYFYHPTAEFYVFDLAF